MRRDEIELKELNAKLSSSHSPLVLLLFPVLVRKDDVLDQRAQTGTAKPKNEAQPVYMFV